MDAPATLLRLPSAREIWELATVDRGVAITAIITAGVVVLGLIAGLVLIVRDGGDAAAIGLAISGVITAAIAAWARLRGKTSPE